MKKEKLSQQLAHKLESRPDKDDLLDRNILKEGDIEVPEPAPQRMYLNQTKQTILLAHTLL